MLELDAVIERVGKLPPAEQRQLEAVTNELVASVGMQRWQPNPGRQTEGYFSEADEVLYGGEPGGGKTDLGLGLAFTAHKRTLFLRRQYTDLSFATERAIAINGSRNGFSGQPPPKLRTSDGRLIEFGAAAKIGDEQHWMGNPHDLLVVDETTQFARSQIRFLMGWLRSDDPIQRCRAVFVTNPPLSPEGMWVTEMFAPWLDPKFQNPAQPGELRWYISDDEGNDKWVDGPGEYPIRMDGVARMVKAKSRTYIPASVNDNPYYVRSGYQKQLDAMPEPFRSILLGGFKTGFKDAPNQAIPTAWVRAAIDRWTSRPPASIPMCAMGVDASGGGADPMTIATRHDGWYAPIVEIKGKEIPVERAGHYCAGIVVSYRRDDAIVIIDMGGGYGGPLYEKLHDNEIQAEGYKGSERSTRRTRDGHRGFANRRSEVYWKFREALDPSQPGGSPISLPDDPLLIADLTSPTYEPDSHIITLEPKESVRARLGRSPDHGDAVVMAWAAGMRYVQGGMALERAQKFGHGRRPQVLPGRLKYSRNVGR